MKSLLSTLAFLVFPAFLFAQLQKGDRLLLFGGEANPAGVLLPRSDLGLFGTSAESDGQFALVLTPEVSFLLSDRFAVGAGVGLVANIGSFSAVAVQFAPHARYYFKNDESGQLYGALTGSIGFGDNLDGAFFGLRPELGYGIPIRQDVLLTPSLSYTVQEGSNALVLGLGTQLRLGVNNRPEPPAAGTLAKGDKLVGVSLGNIQIQGSSRGFTSITLQPDIFFMLGSRFAVGTTVGFDRAWREDISVTNLSAALSGRFYLANDRHTLPFVQLGVGYNTVTTKFNDQTFDADAVFVDGGFGLSIFLRENIALETALGFRALEEDVVIGVTLGARFRL